MESFSTTADILPFVLVSLGVLVDFAGAGFATSLDAGFAPAADLDTDFFGAGIFFAGFAALTGLRAGALVFGAGLRTADLAFFAGWAFFAGFAAFFFGAGFAAGLRFFVAISFTIVPRRSRVIA